MRVGIRADFDPAGWVVPRLCRAEARPTGAGRPAGSCRA